MGGCTLPPPPPFEKKKCCNEVEPFLIKLDQLKFILEVFSHPYVWYLKYLHVHKLLFFICQTQSIDQFSVRTNYSLRSLHLAKNLSIELGISYKK